MYRICFGFCFLRVKISFAKVSTEKQLLKKTSENFPFIRNGTAFCEYKFNFHVLSLHLLLIFPQLNATERHFVQGKLSRGLFGYIFFSAIRQ